jgi:hypothetical protein
MPTTDKEKINDWVRILKRKGIIRFNSDVAKALGYKNGTISGALKMEGGKPVSYTFMEKFKEKYGKYLNDVDDKGLLEEKIASLEIELQVLKEVVLTLMCEISGKKLSRISAELDRTIRSRKTGKVIAMPVKKR